MSAPIASITGIVRSARKMPPMPSVSAIVWRRPWRAGISKSRTVAAKPPTWIMLIAKSAPSSAARRSACALMRARPPSCWLVQCAIASAVSRRSGSMSWSATRTSASSSNASRSPSRSRVNSTLPAPMNAILVTRGSMPQMHDNARMASHSDILLQDFRPRPALRVPETHVPRPRVPAIDAHNHLGRWLSHWVREDGGWVVPDVGALLALMDETGVQAIVNLDGRWDEELEANLDRYDRAHPGRFFTFCH